MLNNIENYQIKSILFDLSKKIILPKYRNLKENEIKRKNNNDLVTSVDIEVEIELSKILCQLIPNSLFVGEEKYSSFPEILHNYKKNQYCWTIDPIDGTSNFAKGKEKFAIMISLSFGDQILQSWIYKPLTEEMCYAIKEEGSYINDKKIIIINESLTKDLKGSISTKYWDGNYYDKMKSIKHNFAEVKSYGCIGYEYIDIVKSLREFAILSKLSPWDHMPGILLIREAGGFDSYFDNGNYNHCFQKKNLVVASNKHIGNSILSIIRE